MKNHDRALDWARRHFDILKADIKRFEQDQEGPLVAESNGVPGEYVMKRAQPIPDFPPEWVFQIGDVVHAVRMSLDYLAHGIVRPTSADQVEKASFPIVVDPTRANWGAMVGLRLPGLDINSDVVKAIHDFQPYRRGNTYGLDPLAVLDGLENIHKHRRPLTVGSASPVRGFQLWGESNFDLVDKYPISSDPGAPIYRIRMHRPDDYPNANFYSPIRVCFDKNGAALGTQVVDTLASIQHYVRRDIFGMLDKYTT